MLLLRRGLSQAVVLLVLAAGLLGPPAQAQSGAAAPDSSRTLLRVTHVSFSGNDLFSDLVLRARVRTAANRRFLGIPGFTWWLWLYRIGASETFGRRLGEALMASGEPPAFLDASVVAADVERLHLFYQQEGFRRVQVAARIDTTHRRTRARVTFVVTPGAPTYVRHVVYHGLDALDDDQRLRLVRGSLLRPQRIDPAQPLRFDARRQRYSEPLLLEERRRLLTFLRNEGFAAATRDSIRAIVTPSSPDSFDIRFETRPGPRYRFGDIRFDVEGPEAAARPRADTLRLGASPDSASYERVSWRIRNEQKLTPGLLTRSLQFQPGDWYNQAQLLATKRRMEASGLFSFTDIVSLQADTLRPGPGAAPVLPHRIVARTRPRHQVRFETFMVQRSGVIGGVGNELGAGLGVSYENANVFGGGETWRLSTTGSLAADVDSTFFSSAQAEVTTSLTLPYLIFPFQRLDRRFKLFQARTRLSLSLLTAQREDLRLVIRGRGTTRLRSEMRHTATLTSLVDLLDLSLSNPDTLNGFRVRFLDRILGTGDTLLVTDPVQRAQILEDYTQPQINNALRYTFRSARFNPLRREQGYSYEAAVELGGNLPYLLDRFVFSPDSLEGSLPGLPFFRGGRSRNRMVYRQYVRFITDLRRYRPISRSTVLAWKVVGGWAHPTGRADVVPFDRRFFAGGASSVRGWGLRELGPGAASFSNDAAGPNASTNILGGDIKLEASVELRSTFVRNVLAANWIVAFFTDAGNVWFGPRNPGFRDGDPATPSGTFDLGTFYKEVGVGSGVGLRIAWEYLIVRLDVAYRMYDPAAPGAGLFSAREWYFGIGHAF